MPSGELLVDPLPRSTAQLSRLHHPPRPPPSTTVSTAQPFPFPSNLRLLALNNDVLRVIIDFCPLEDALKLALTCKSAYGFAMPHIVSDVTIGDPGDDDGPDRLKKFCELILSKPELARAVRVLRLIDGAFARPASTGGRSGWGADFSAASLLTQLLAVVVNLRVLHIRDAEPLFQSHPAVCEAIVKLERLRVLSLYYIGNTSLKAISQLQGRLHVIENGLWKDGPRPQGDVTPFGRYSESLRRIRLWECGCMLESIVDRHVWPDVHTLDIGGRVAKVSELARAFPNLRRLTFHLEFSVKQETGPVECWSELDFLETSAPIPQFPSRVRRLQLNFPISGARSPSQNDLKALPLVDKASPVVFCVTFSPMMSETFLERMASGLSSVRYMELVISDGACGRAGIPWQMFEDWVVRNLEIMRQTALVGLCISYAGTGSTAKISAQQRNRIIHMARLLTRTINTLQYIGVGYHDEDAGNYASDCVWFKATGRGADTSMPATYLEELSIADAERFREALLSTQREENS